MRPTGMAIWGLIIALLMSVSPGVADDAPQPTRDDYLRLAQTGWVFELSSSRKRRSPAFPPIRFNSGEVAKGEICLFGAPPHALSRQIIGVFNDLLRDIYDRRLAVTFAGRDISNCPSRQRVYVRLYDDRLPTALYRADLVQLDHDFDIRLPSHGAQPVATPAQVNVFFGAVGPVAHLLVNQPDHRDLTRLERDYFTSILIEELFQVVSFGRDVAKFDAETPFLSKLQERPVNLRLLPWQSESFMAGLLKSNPSGLCAFDVFMLHSLAAANLETVNSDELIVFIKAHFDELLDRSVRTLDNPAYRPLLDQRCLALPR
ncbi:hypothetical protein [Hoeflea ulvae]|uniref:DUF2927 domain-containing protein n=1 Tax=Hoeflea ulvae TaxID=2983764 RepID=A0ABT3YKX6_9HYPH|nr:hypothetical protein [Hoeflea ulvae]MCY0096498.1 hypothetical protein [Hoeflea ulvae]